MNEDLTPVRMNSSMSAPDVLIGRASPAWALALVVTSAVVGCRTQAEDDRSDMNTPAERAVAALAEARLAPQAYAAGGAEPAWLDAERLVYVAPSAEGRVIRLAHLDGTAPTDVVPGTRPAPHPSGEQLAFLSATGQLALVRVRDRVVTPLDARPTTLLGGLPYAWSPDGERLAALELGPAGTEARVFTRGGERLQTLQIPWPADNVAWVDAERLVSLANEESGARLVVLSPSTGESRAVPVQLGIVVEPRVWPVPGTSRVRVLRNVLDPNAELFAYQYELIEVDLESGQSQVVVDAAHWMFRGVALLRDPAAGEIELLTRTAGAQYVLRTLDASGRVRRERALPLELVSGLCESPDGRHVAWVGEALDDRLVLRVARLAGDGALEARDLALLRDERPSDIPLATVDAVTWTTRDGVTLGGLVFAPKSTDGAPLRPLWVDVHGGPEGGIEAAGSLLLSTVLEWHLLASMGFVVFVADYRSSGVAGLEARLDAPRPLPVTELRDILEGVDAVAARHPVDRGRIVLLGHSAGGAAAQFALTSADRTLAAVIVKESGVSVPPDLDGPAFVYWFGAGEEGRARYGQSYPLVNAARVVTPTLFLAGEVPGDGSAREMRPLFDALAAAGRAPTRFVSYPGEGHVFARRETLEGVLRNVRDFLEREAGLRLRD